MAFQFGAGTGGFSFGTPAASTQTNTTSFGASTQPSFSFSTPTLQSTPAPLGGAATNLFGGAGQTGGLGSSFGSAQPQAVTGGFGMPAATQPASSASAFSFGSSSLFGSAGGTSVPTATTASSSLFSGGFSLGAAKAATTAAPSVFGAQISASGPAGSSSLFGSAGGTSVPTANTASGSLFSGGFSLGATKAATTAAPSVFGAQTSAPVAAGSAAVLSAPSTVGVTSTLSGLLGLSSAPASSSVLGSLLATPTTSPAAVPAFGQAFGATQSVPTASFGTTQATPTASSTSAVPASFGLGLTTTSTATSTVSAGFGLSFNAAASSAPNTSSAFGLTLPTSSTVCTSAASTATSSSITCKPACSMTYRQLEESINKWTIELEEQEAIFLEQATQVNAWDRLLIDNGEKISQLNSDVECVKIDQARLTQELDFILGQQRELEDLLTPLEQAMDQLPPTNYQQHADVEREHTYKLAENIDAQLKQMATDLKEIVEHLNVSSGNQDSCDPLVQISKILNAHVDSLQWIDHSTELVKQRMDSVSRQLDVQRKQQINKLHIGSN